MERSEQEKFILNVIIPESDLLPYELIGHLSEEFGPEIEYDIPDEEKEAVVKKLWPFAEMPGLDEEVLDIHNDTMTTLRKCKVIRWEKRNILVSENYFLTGGTLLDLVKR